MAALVRKPKSGNASSGDGVGARVSPGAPVFPGSAFYRISVPKRQSVCLIFGDAGTGKTTFATDHAPEPIALINLDQRDEWAASKAASERDIMRMSVPIPRTFRLSNEAAIKLGQETLTSIVTNFEIAVREANNGRVRTICIDTASELADIISLSIRGKSVNAPKDYGRSKDLINRQWWQLFNMVRDCPAHLVMLARASEKWENNEPTGEFYPRVPSVVSDAVDWSAQIRVRRASMAAGGGGLKKRATAGGPKEFELKITKSGNVIEELGQVYDSVVWNELGGPFQYACSMLYPNTTQEDWR